MQVLLSWHSFASAGCPQVITIKAIFAPSAFHFALRYRYVCVTASVTISLRLRHRQRYDIVTFSSPPALRYRYVFVTGSVTISLRFRHRQRYDIVTIRVTQKKKIFEKNTFIWKPNKFSFGKTSKFSNGRGKDVKRIPKRYFQRYDVTLNVTFWYTFHIFPPRI